MYGCVGAQTEVIGLIEAKLHKKKILCNVPMKDIPSSLKFLF